MLTNNNLIDIINTLVEKFNNKLDLPQIIFHTDFEACSCVALNYYIYESKQVVNEYKHVVENAMAFMEYHDYAFNADPAYGIACFNNFPMNADYKEAKQMIAELKDMISKAEAEIKTAMEIREKAYQLKSNK